MFAPFLLTIVVVSASADGPTGAAAFIGQLGSPSFDDRVAAYRALDHLGREALPALRAAAGTSNARVRSRVSTLIESIAHQVESDRLAQPTMIRLDFRNQALSEVVDALNDCHDLGLSLRLRPEPGNGMMMVFDQDEPGRLKELRARKITLEPAQLVSFWDAIDRLCEAGGLRYDVASGYGLGIRYFHVVLLRGRTGRVPVSDSGPFRVQMTGFRADFDRGLSLDPDPARARAQPAGGGKLNIPLAVIPEPGLMLYENGPVLVTEATDERGRSMVPRPGPPHRDRRQPKQSSQSRYVHELATIHVNAVVVAPEPGGTVICRLRGKVPVIAVMRSSHPIVIPLEGEGLSGKSVSTRDMTLIVDKTVLVPGARTSVTVTIRETHGDLAPSLRPDPRRPDVTAFARERVLEHLELHDAAGRRLDHVLGGGQISGADSHGFYRRLELIVSPRSEDGSPDAPGTSKLPVPAELRYYGFVQKAIEVPFDLRDIPMP